MICLSFSIFICLLLCTLHCHSVFILDEEICGSYFDPMRTHCVNPFGRGSNNSDVGLDESENQMYFICIISSSLSG